MNQQHLSKKVFFLHSNEASSREKETRVCGIALVDIKNNAILWIYRDIKTKIKKIGRKNNPNELDKNRESKKKITRKAENCVIRERKDRNEKKAKKKRDVTFNCPDRFLSVWNSIKFTFHFLEQNFNGRRFLSCFTWTQNSSEFRLLISTVTSSIQ